MSKSKICHILMVPQATAISACQCLQPISHNGLKWLASHLAILIPQLEYPLQLGQLWDEFRVGLKLNTSRATSTFPQTGGSCVSLGQGSHSSDPMSCVSCMGPVHRPNQSTDQPHIPDPAHVPEWPEWADHSRSSVGPRVARTGTAFSMALERLEWELDGPKLASPGLCCMQSLLWPLHDHAPHSLCSSGNPLHTGSSMHPRVGTTCGALLEESALGA